MCNMTVIIHKTLLDNNKWAPAKDKNHIFKNF